MRLLDLLKKSSGKLEKAGLDDAFTDAEMLVFHAAGIDRLDAYVNNPEVSPSVSSKVRRFLQRRLKGEPVQYIIGHIEFLGLTINVGKGVLIPRPETEMLVQEAIQTVASNKLSATSKKENSSHVTRHSALSILDLCTGSGCIALALAREFPEAYICGTDISKKALSYAQKNAKINTINNVSFLPGSLYDPVRLEKFDIITANPPYIRKQEIETLQPEVRDWEPVTALDGGPDGLDFCRIILSEAPNHLKPSGWIFLELGYDQAEDVKQIAANAGLREIEVIDDYSGIGRVLKAGM